MAAPVHVVDAPHAGGPPAHVARPSIYVLSAQALSSIAVTERPLDDDLREGAPAQMTPLEPVLLAAAALAVLAIVADAVRLAIDRHRRAELTAWLDRVAADPQATGTALPRTDRRLGDTLARLEARLAEARALATTDLLTGLLNRQTILTRLATEIERAGRYRRPLAVALIDLDHFKRINDTYGHAAGDLVLHQAASLLRSNIRSVDMLGRYGGEEFLLILPETDVEAASSLAEKLRRAVGSELLPVTDGDSIRITISVGVAGGSGGSLRLDALMHDADAATYAAKSLGRDQVYIFRAASDDELVHRAAISANARKEALDVGRAALDAAQERLTGELESRTPWAGKPSLMIAKVAEAVARTVGLPEGEIERIRTASLLHDLGKLAIPEEILSKPGDLDEHEWRAVAEHPRIGQVILEQAGALRDAATIVVHHHEWFDGRGYPHGLAGHDIPIGSRIVSIADAYEAMVSGRPYRAAMTHDEAIDELQRYSGAQFDPELVDVFVSVFGAGVPWPTSAPEVEAERRARLVRAIQEAQPENDPGLDAAGAIPTAMLAATGTEG